MEVSYKCEYCGIDFGKDKDSCLSHEVDCFERFKISILKRNIEMLVDQIVDLSYRGNNSCINLDRENINCDETDCGVCRQSVIDKKKKEMMAQYCKI